MSVMSNILLTLGTSYSPVISPTLRVLSLKVGTLKIEKEE